MTAWSCSIRTPIANGFAVISTLRLCSISYVSRALWPTPESTTVVSIRSSPLTSTPMMRSFSINKSVTLAPNLTSPPHSIMRSRIAFTMVRNLSVPTWGLCLYKISSGAPNSTKYLEISCNLGWVTRVVNLPSEKVPAPPSPNCTFDSGLNTPSFQNVSTSWLRVSTSWPRSRTIGRYPSRAR